jgi:HEAT repeat protein
MIDALAFGSALLVVLSAVVLTVLVTRRFALARAERRRLAAEERLRPFALALIAGETEGPALTGRDAVVFAELLGRYARQLRGDAAVRIAAFFERQGSVAREIVALDDRRTWRRAVAAYALGDMSSPSAVPALLDALKDGERDVRAAAARSLGRLGAVEAVGALVEALAARRVPPAVAGYALVQIGRDAVPALDPLLAHEDPLVRARACELLGVVGDASAAESLIAPLRDSSAEVRARAARALGRVGAEEAAAELRSALDDRVAFVRTAAASALGAIRDHDAFDPLLQQAETDEYHPAHAAGAALRAIDSDRLVQTARDTDAAPHVVEAADLAAV